MHILLPPSETKRDGGDGPRVDLDSLSFPALLPVRSEVLAQLESLVQQPDAVAAAALKLGERIASAELARNRDVRSSPTMPAIDRYTGVLFDALNAATLSEQARRRAHDHVLVQSALFGLVRAADLIPAYRLSHDARLPGIRLARHWASPSSRELTKLSGPIIDLRSAGYSALGPLPEDDRSVTVAVVAADDDGAVRALNHFNKKGKGAFVRALLDAGDLPDSIDEVCVRATELGWPLRRTGGRELELRVPNALQR